MRVLILNGPNLNRLGTREPRVYGSLTLDDLQDRITHWAGKLGFDVSFLQSNHEGELVDAIQDAAALDGIIVNPGALTHTSRSIGDAILSTGVPTVEVHISNIKQRERWRAESLVSAACVRTIYGRGVGGYQDALRHLRNRMAMGFETIRYGPHRENLADLRVPSGDATGLVVLVHGGLWREEFERDTTESLAVDLTERGYATWNVEYRRVGNGGVWPGSPHDVLTALDAAQRSERLSHLPLSLVGHSAGGHLGLWAAARRTESVSLIVGLAPVTDLTSMASSGEVGAKEARELLDSGAPPRLNAVPGKTLLIHGENDEVVPVSHSTRLDSGTSVQVMSGMGHFQMLDPGKEHWPLVLAGLGKSLR